MEGGVRTGRNTHGSQLRDGHGNTQQAGVFDVETNATAVQTTALPQGICTRLSSWQEDSRVCSDLVPFLGELFHLSKAAVAATQSDGKLVPREYCFKKSIEIKEQAPHAGKREDHVAHRTNA